jgi:hypothetical protein
MLAPSTGRDVAARNGLQNSGQHLPAILDGPQRRQLDPETLRRIDGSRRPQELRREQPQQMRLAVEQIRQRSRAQRAGWRDRVCGAWDCLSFLWRNRPRASRARRQGIRTKQLIFLKSRSGKQVTAGGRRRIGNNLQHSGAPVRAKLTYEFAICSFQEDRRRQPTRTRRHGGRPLAWADA